MTDPRVDAYLERSPWCAELQQLREILLRCGLRETCKWGAPAYTYNNRNIIGLGSFKSYYGLWFHQGVFLKDRHKKLVNANAGVTKAMRQWRFKKADVVDVELVELYVSEAIVNARNGKALRPQARRINLPEELENAMDNNIRLREAFQKLSRGRQIEYADYIGNGRQVDTRVGRLRKSMPLILKGVGLNDKYRKKKV